MVHLGKIQFSVLLPGEMKERIAKTKLSPDCARCEDDEVQETFSATPSHFVVTAAPGSIFAQFMCQLNLRTRSKKVFIAL